MKTLTVAFALLASFNLFAQEPQTTNEPQNQDQSQAAQVQKSQPAGLAIKENKVFITENGATKEITEAIWMRNGMQITPSGILIFPNGERATLREGDVADLRGAVARPVPLGTETASK